MSRLKGGGRPGSPWHHDHGQRDGSPLRKGGHRQPSSGAPGLPVPPPTGHDWAWALDQLAAGHAIDRMVIRQRLLGAPERLRRTLDPTDHDTPLVAGDIAAKDWRLAPA